MPGSSAFFFLNMCDGVQTLDLTSSNQAEILTQLSHSRGQGTPLVIRNFGSAEDFNSIMRFVHSGKIFETEFPIRMFVNAKNGYFYLDGTWHPEAFLTTSMSVDTTLSSFLSPTLAWPTRYAVLDDFMNSPIYPSSFKEDLFFFSAFPGNLSFGSIFFLLFDFLFLFSKSEKPTMSQLFLASGETQTQLHRDNFDNVYCCLTGEHPFLFKTVFFTYSVIFFAQCQR